MKTYNTMLNSLCNKYWEELTQKEKEMLVIGNVMTKPTVIPNEVQFQKAIMNTLNLNIDKISNQKLLEEFLNIRNLLFQAIKEDVEKDLEKEWDEDTEENENFEKDHKQFVSELLKDHPDFLEFINGAQLFK